MNKHRNIRNDIVLIPRVVKSINETSTGNVCFCNYHIKVNVHQMIILKMSLFFFW